MGIEADVRRLTLTLLALYGGIACAPRQIESQDIAGKNPPLVSATQTPEPLPTLILPTPTSIPIPHPTFIPPAEITPKREMASPELIELLHELNNQYNRITDVDSGPSIIRLCQAMPEIKIEQATGVWTWPTYGPIYQYFRLGHQALDIGDTFGIGVYAADGGIVVGTFDYSWGLGKHILLWHGSRRMTLYAHLSRMEPDIGQYVERGERIGMTGATGLATGPHLHFEAILDCLHVNPLKLLPR